MTNRTYLLSEPPEKTETMTLRLPLSIVKSLKNDAEFEKVSVNSLAIRIFSDHISWEKYERKVGLLPMTKVFLENAIAKMTEDEVVNLAEKNEKDYFKNIIIFMKREHSKKEFIKILRSWLSVSWMQHVLELKEGNYYFMIRHDLGGNWSLYIKALLSVLSRDSFDDDISIKTTKSTISIVIPSQNDTAS